MKHQTCKLKHKSKHLDLQQNVRCANEYEHKVHTWSFKGIYTMTMINFQWTQPMIFIAHSQFMQV
jgi:CO dehydrogenase/acetyl-CoA synthase delta subunit